MASSEVSVVDGQLRIAWFGVLDPATVAEAMPKVKQELAANPKTVVVITNGVTDCPEAVRKDLVTLQRELGQRGRRSAWVDERARFRGLALWVMHLADDQNSKAVASLELARRWVTSSEAREAGQRKAVGA
ncbi:MAG: hypothetical protein Q8L48_08145 [Archangium sp.]|nr:hypothetical protein [Archangium sp.]